MMNASPSFTSLSYPPWRTRGWREHMPGTHCTAWFVHEQGIEK
jgi:hypothetical protein